LQLWREEKNFGKKFDQIRAGIIIFRDRMLFNPEVGQGKSVPGFHLQYRIIDENPENTPGVP
jgi:hypothetical protein